VGAREEEEGEEQEGEVGKASCPSQRVQDGGSSGRQVMCDVVIQQY